MNKLTRILALVLALTLSLSLAACGGAEAPAAPASGDVAAKAPMQFIEAEEAKDLLNDEGYVFFDLRKTADVSTNSIPGAQAYDMTAAREGDEEAGKAAMTEATKGLDKKIILICYSGKNYAQTATNALSAIGYDTSKVYTLKGGFNNWSEIYPELTTTGAAEAPAATEAPAAEVKDTFIYAMTADPGNVANYYTSDDRISMSMLAYINDGLFTLMPDGSYKFTIADSFDASEDGLTYTAKIKTGMKWSDGDDMTMEDILFSFETFMANDDSLSVNGEPCVVTAIDDTTLEFKLPGTLASFPESVADVPMLAKHIFEGRTEFDMDLTNPASVVGCGPYKFAEYKSGEYIKLVRNDNYVGGEIAALENFVIQIITNAETAKAALIKGDVDAHVVLANELEGLEDFNIVPYSEGRVAYTRINRVSPNMQDADVRKAIFYAIDRNVILQAAYSSLDFATPSVSIFPKTNGYYSENIEQYNQDVAKAQELLAGKTLPTLKICYIGTDAAQTAMATVMQAQLAAVGINLELHGLDQAGYMASAYDNNDTTYDLYLGGYIMSIDPDGFSAMFTTGCMMNFNMPEMDALFQEGKSYTDPAKRAEVYQKIQELAADSALFYPFGTNLRLLALNPDVKGYEDAALVPIVTFEDISKLHF